MSLSAATFERDETMTPWAVAVIPTSARKTPYTRIRRTGRRTRSSEPNTAALPHRSEIGNSLRERTGGRARAGMERTYGRSPPNAWCVGATGSAAVLREGRRRRPRSRHRRAPGAWGSARSGRRSATARRGGSGTARFLPSARGGRRYTGPPAERVGFEPTEPCDSTVFKFSVVGPRASGDVRPVREFGCWTAHSSVVVGHY